MKKRSFLCRVLALCVAGAAFLLSSCKSTPDLAPVDAFDLLDSNAALYLTIPVQANSEFVTAAIQKVAKVAESDAKKITERLETAYIAVDSKNELQLSAQGNIPTSFVGLALSEKNGWTAGASEGQLVYTHKQTAYRLCLPSSSNAFLSHDISQMARRFNKIAYADFSDESLSKNKKIDSQDILSAKNSDIKILSESLSQANYQFLHENLGDSMMLYSENPRVFIRNFLGSLDVKTSISSIYATIRPYNDVKGYDYNIKLVLNLSDARTIKATEALLKVGLFGMAAKISQTASSQITIVDLLVTKNQIVSLIK